MEDRPGLVFIAGIGTNDAYSSVPTPQVEENLGQLIEKFRAENVIVLLAGMRVRRDFEWRYQLSNGWKLFIKTAVNSYLELRKRPPIFHASTWQYNKKFRGVHARVAKKHNVPLYPYLLAGVRREMWNDMIHVNPKGVSVMVERIMPFIIKHLDEHIGKDRT